MVRLKPCPFEGSELGLLMQWRSDDRWEPEDGWGGRALWWCVRMDHPASDLF
jgi:hypothetical protein